MLRLIILQLLALIALTAEAAAVNLAGRQIEVAIPAGYCQFGTRLVDIALARVILSEIGNDNQVLAYFANCEELDAYRHGDREALDNFGLVFAQTRNGNKLMPIPGKSRRDFIKEMGGVIIPDVAEVVKNGETQFKQALSKGRIPLDSQQAFHLQADDNGAYFGIFGQVTDVHGERSNMLGVFGISLVKEMFLSIEIYQRFTSTPPLEDLLDRQQAAMAKLVEANQ